VGKLPQRELDADGKQQQDDANLRQEVDFGLGDQPQTVWARDDPCYKKSRNGGDTCSVTRGNCNRA